MLHVHVIITAVVLLVGAFAALIICMCVDIVPIIKSRGSTLASRDSATQEQARKLKKSLRRTKQKLSESTQQQFGRADKLESVTSVPNQNIYECNAKSANSESQQDNSAQAKYVSCCTPTTTSVVVTTVSTMDEKPGGKCPTSPEGDHSTQETSAASSLSQSSDKILRQGSYVNQDEVVDTRDRPSASKSHVSVSVHCSSKLTHSAESSPAVSRALLPKRSSPHEKLCRQDSSESKYYNFPLKDPSPERCHYRRAPTSREYDSRCSTEDDSASPRHSEYRGSPSSHRDYHDAPWDSSPRDSLVYRGQQSPCKWCYADHMHCKRHNHVAPPAAVPPSPLTPLLERKHAQVRDRSEDSTQCPCPYHRRKNAPPPVRSKPSQERRSSPHIRHHYSPHSPSKSHESRNSPSRYLAGGASSLHGTGINHRSSPSSSASASPSSLSSSSHSSKRRRRTKLEDIQEDAGGWSDQDPTAEDLKTKSAPNGGFAHRQTPSNLHSSLPDDAEDSDSAAFSLDPKFLSQYLGMKRGSRDLAIVNDAKAAIEGLVTYSGT